MKRLGSDALSPSSTVARFAPPVGYAWGRISVKLTWLATAILPPAGHAWLRWPVFSLALSADWAGMPLAVPPFLGLAARQNDALPYRSTRQFPLNDCNGPACVAPPEILDTCRLTSFGGRNLRSGHSDKPSKRLLHEPPQSSRTYGRLTQICRQLPTRVTAPNGASWPSNGLWAAATVYFFPPIAAGRQPAPENYIQPKIAIPDAGLA